LFFAGCLALNAHLPLPWHHEHFTAGPMVQLGDTDGKTAVTIAWRTEAPANSTVRYGKTSYAEHEATEPFVSTQRHTMPLVDLEPSTCYEYRVQSNEKYIGSGRFCTFKKPNEPFSFAVFGDSGYGRPVQRNIADLIRQKNVDFVIHTGDLIYPYGKEQKYGPFLYKPYKRILANTFFFPSMGNHDARTADGAPLLNNFRLPNHKSYYSFMYANAYVIALDSTRVNDPAQTVWLIQELAYANVHTDIRWRFVFFHHPPYSNKEGYDGDGLVRERWAPFFYYGNVDVVFSGHNHIYTRFRRLDDPLSMKHTTYIIEGVGGREHYETIKRDDPRVAATDGSAYGFGLVEIEGNNLRFRHLTHENKIIDEFAIAHGQ
jgi:predicted phosphodiesterase